MGVLSLDLEARVRRPTVDGGGLGSRWIRGYPVWFGCGHRARSLAPLGGCEHCGRSDLLCDRRAPVDRRGCWTSLVGIWVVGTNANLSSIPVRTTLTSPPGNEETLQENATAHVSS